MEAAEFLRKKAEEQGFTLPDGIEDKLYRFGIKAGVVAARAQDVAYFSAKEKQKRGEL